MRKSQLPRSPVYIRHFSDLGRAKLMYEIPSFEDFCEEAVRLKIASRSAIDNHTSPQPLSSNPPYATFLFHSAAQAKQIVDAGRAIPVTGRAVGSYRH